MSREEKVLALVVDGFALGESDQVVNAFTSNGDLVRFVAKGARKTKSRNSAAVQPFVLGRYIISTAYSLPILRQADIVKSYSRIRTDLVRCTAALSAMELIKLTVAEAGGEHAAFDLTRSYLEMLDNHPADSLVFDAFRLQFLSLLGYGLVWSQCVLCGAETAQGRLNWLEGGICCAKCSDERGLPVAADTLGIIRRLTSTPLPAIGRISVTREQRRCCSALVDQIVVWHTDGKTKTQAFRNLINDFQQ